jgi:capsular exopolysaccharide synthesis family protein
MIRRHGRIVGFATGLCLALALLFVTLVTPLYTATSTVLIEPRHAETSEAGRPVLRGVGADDAVIESQVSLMQSLSVIRRVVDSLKLADDPEFVPPSGVLEQIRSLFVRAPSTGASPHEVARSRAVDTLQQHLTIVREPSTFLVDISAHSSDRAKAASIANAVAQAYFSDQARTKFDATDAAAGRLRNQLERLQSRADESELAVRDYRSQLAIDTDTGTQAQQRLTELQRDADANRALYDRFRARAQAPVAQDGLDTLDSRIVMRADVPVRPSIPNIPLTLGLALLIGLGFGCILALAVDYLDRRIKTQDQAKASGFPSLAAIPEVNARELAHLARCGRADLESYDLRRTRLLPAGLQPPILRYAISQPMSPFAEAIRSIRFALQHEARARTAQVISITSAMGGEGKTTVAANLAQSLSVLGIKVVLVEGDLRNPQLSRALCPAVRSGLLEVALAQMPLNQAILVDPVTNLAIMPAPLPKDVALLTEFASSEGMSAILTELRSHFDVMIVDAPPLLPLVDGRAIVEQSDAVILTVGWNRTPRDMFLRAVELLNPVHDRVIGSVLTRVDLGRLKLYEAFDSNLYSAAYISETVASREVETSRRAN